ncbi:carbamoyl phosphate synthase small subunit [Candidatus Roizmanbacteria bacterium RIFCSPLOWO2_01_FULL_41_22]|uniref:Carbamoyl phosphate synthase small chain n=2 Tax=Candidatus Roizmaniibacteriota TaxID=1752723 RepID=A0A1F7JRB1_9BACT|nr:MAG: carbamoyl phosphate synthase small subunit [Candidatus Roizmanbacteria bacterium RIFCSPLOWO2_01_FULL_41_22]OGK58165.1 MAG: carbamoyl phosphate synthase small subunit [Candidatus Roizmanbacteria bacterium RIFCSPLOWO2_02_FULL_41_9]
MKKAILILNNNQIYRGKGFGATGCFFGELVFNTAMTGYMEAITDPSYAGQILTFTYPLIGNYGISRKWGESPKIYPVAIVVSELNNDHYHRDAHDSLENLLAAHHIGGIAGIDTRSIVNFLRNHGCIPAVLSVYEQEGRDFVKAISTQKKIIINEKGGNTVALIDYGAKESIVQELIKENLKVVIYPSTVKAKEILSDNPQGIILSNGPGDPVALPYAISTIRALLKTTIPIFGICLGHQLMALADGGETYKLKFGHRGLNHPVLDIKSQKAFFTSQNHGYAVKAESLSKNWETLFININDGTVEGFIHRNKPFFSVQFHPEANPGPHDTTFLFKQFKALL